MRGNIFYKHLLSTFSPIFCIFLLNLIYSQADDVSCNKCVDSEGNPCNDVIRRFANSKFWIMKGDRKGTFEEASEQCHRLGFQIAEINSEAEQLTFVKLATSEKDRYWVGFVQQDYDDEWTKMDLTTPLAWEPDWIEEGFDVYEEGRKAISVDTTGEWYSSSVSEQCQIVCQFPVTSPCYRGNGKKPSPAKPDKGTTNNPQCPEPEFEDNQLVRTGPNSKFLYPKRAYFTSATEATSLCSKFGLEPAIIGGKWEYQHLVKFIYEMNLNNTRVNFKVNLGAINNGLGIFTYLNRMPPLNQLKFQAFKLKDGEYFADGDNCLAIEWHRAYHYFIPISCNKKSEVMPLCQYKPDQSCSIESPLTLQDESAQLNKMFKVGESETNVYYGAMKQRTWHDADQVCRANSLKLIGFQKGKPEMIQEKLKFIDDYRKSIETKAWSGYSWTSGRFRHERELVFDQHGESWNVNDNYTYWRWNDQLTTDRERENCLLVTANGMRPVLCELPNYFVCYAAKTPATIKENLKAATKSEESDVHRESVPVDETTRPPPRKCEYDGTKLTVSFTPGGLTSTEIIGIITTSIAMNFSQGLTDDLPINEKSRWRIPQLQELVALTKIVCPEEYVRPTFLNLLSNFIMVYYNSVEEEYMPKKHDTFWRNLLHKYPTCKSNTHPLTLNSTGGLITEFSGDGRTGIVNIINEKADSFPVLDYMLEGLWYMFEIAAATCYKSTKSNILWLSDFFYYFRKYFTDQFKKWWVSPGETNYGLLFGDMDLYESLYNLRACSVASFQRLDIEDMLLVRPVDVDNGDHIAKSINQRT